MRRKLGRSTNLVRAEDPPVPPGECVFDRTFPAADAAKGEALEALMAALAAHGQATSREAGAHARLCLDEALTNAVMHGCKHDGSKSIRVRAFVTPDDWSVLVEDPGEGFREEDLPDPQAPENLLEESGRGVHLMRSMTDTVSYWRGGSAVLLRNRNAKGGA